MKFNNSFAFVFVLLSLAGKSQGAEDNVNREDMFVKKGFLILLSTKDYKTALVSGISTISTGLIVKFLTKAASYKAVDIFNGIAIKKIKEIFSIKPASGTMGIGLYVKLG